MENILTFIFAGSIAYYFSACIYVYVVLAQTGMPVKLFYITTPGYLYMISKGSFPVLRFIALSTIFSFSLILISTVMIIGENI